MSERDAPGARPDGPPPGQEERDRALVLFFGMIGPVEADLVWSGHHFTVELHILTVEEERKLARDVARQDPENRLLADAMLRMAYSLRTVDGQRIAFDAPDPDAEFKARMEWIATWPATLLDAAIGTYAWATHQPLLRLEELRADPNSDAAPS